MIEQRVKLADERNIWQRTDYGKTVVNQITLQESESIPENSTIHNIDFWVILGSVSLKLNDEESIYSSGSVVNIPEKTIISVSNQSEQESTIFLVGFKSF